MALVLREELIEFSVLQLIREELPNYGVVLTGPDTPGQNHVHLREAFPTADERVQELKVTACCFGFNMDDGGREMELGSNLTEYRHTLEVWTFALSPMFGRHVAHAIKHIVRKNNDYIPILNYNDEGDPIEDATMYVMKAQAKHQANNSPRPWDRFVWTTAIVLVDEYNPE